MIAAIGFYLAIQVAISADYSWLTEVKPIVRIEATQHKVVR